MRKIVIIIVTVIVLLIGGLLGREFLPQDQLKQTMLIQLIQSYGLVQIHIDNAIAAYEDNELEVFSDQLLQASAEAHVANRLMNSGATKQLIDIGIPNDLVSTNNTIIELKGLVVKDNVSAVDIKVIYEMSERFKLLFESIDITELSSQYNQSSRLKDKIITEFRDAGFGDFNPNRASTGE